jgi:hypothetical protein
MSNKNKHGLSRDILADTRRSVRQRCGFGCVICGLAISQYEHLDPPFSEAKEHDPNNIVLLCGSCHDRVTRGIWSKEKVKKAAANPFCIRRGYARDEFDIGDKHPEVIVGKSRWLYTTTIIEMLGVKVLTIEPPEEVPEEVGVQPPYRLSGLFFDDQGNKLFEIDRNEWKGPVENWDIEAKGGKLTIRKKPSRKQLGEVALELSVSPPNQISITKINMVYLRGKLIGDGSGFQFIAPDQSTIQIENDAIGLGCNCGISISNTAIHLGRSCVAYSTGESWAQFIQQLRNNARNIHQEIQKNEALDQKTIEGINLMSKVLEENDKNNLE